MTRRGDGVGRPMLAAGAIFALFFGGIAGWVWQAPVAGAVIATGEIKVEGESKTVQHLEGGLVEAILVAEGERIAAGQPLVRLDATEAQATRAGLLAERVALGARAVRLRAELDGRETLDFTPLGDGGDSLEAATASQTALFAARARERRAEVEMLNGTLARLASRVLAIRAEIEGVGEQLVLLEEDAAVSRELTEGGIVTRAATRTVERDLAGLRGAQASLRAQLAEAQAAEGEAELQRAESDTKRVSAISEELSEVVARMAEIAPVLDAAEKRIARAEIRAPVAGVVVGLAVVTVGGVVAPGEPIMDIVPQTATLIAEARVAPADRERLAQDMVAEVRVAGTQRRQDAAIDGIVTRISADRLPGDAEDGESYYAMTVALSDTPAGMSLAPGMPVTAIVATTSRSVIDYLLSPIRDAISRSMREE